MSQTDEDLYAPDFIRQIDLSLPGNYRTGLVVYNSSAIQVSKLGQAGLGGIGSDIEEIKYEGYTNAGEGLRQAKELFSGDSASRQMILMISDGEIDMETAEATEAERELFDRLVNELAEADITVDIVSLGSGFEDEANIYEAARISGGEIYTLESTEDLPAAAHIYLLERCAIPAMMVGRISGPEAELPVILPDTYMDSVRIMLSGVPEDTQVNIVGQAERIQVEQGAGFAVVNIEKPRQNDYILQLTAASAAEITAFLTAEYTLAMTAESSYRTEDGTAYFELDILNPDGNSLLAGHLADVPLTVLLDGQEYRLSGSRPLQLSQPMINSREVPLQLQLPQSYARYVGVLEAATLIEVPPPEEPPQINYFLIAVIVLLVGFLVMLLVWSGKKKRHYTGRLRKRSGGDPLQPDTATSGSEFWGKVSVYVINSSDGIDHHPESINLAARCSRESITLQWMLDTCNLPLLLKDADKIIFRPGEGRSLLVKNVGRVTALKGREVLARYHSYPVHFHEKVTFVFDDDPTGVTATEIEIYYNDLKINER